MVVAFAMSFAGEVWAWEGSDGEGTEGDEDRA